MVKRIKDLTSVLAGVSGEYFVAAELSRRGLIASITLRNTKGVDILASDAEANSTVGIQVKSNRSSSPVWILNEKAETYAKDGLFYVFVNLKDIDVRPDFYVVPSSVVAEHVARTHREWLEKPGRDGQAHNDNPVRNFRDREGTYLERWELIGL